MLNEKKHIPSRIYVVVSLLSFAALLLSFLLSRGEMISRWFFQDTRDTGMDFFHSIEYLRGRAPYDRFNTLYPPLANLLFYVIYRFIPYWIVESWEDSFSASVAARGTNIDLRTYQAPMVMFLLFLIMCTILLVAFSELTLKNRKEAKLVGICTMFSIGVLYAFERGNILILSVILLMYFLLNYKSEKAWKRETAIVALAIAAGLKLYPAFFGVLLLRDKQWKAAIKAVIYGVLTVVLPCLVLQEGIRAIRVWLEVVRSFANEGSANWVGLGFSNLLYMLRHLLEQGIGVTMDDGGFQILTYMVVACLLISSIFERKEWKAVFSIVLALVLFQSQGIYILSMFLLPLLLLLRDENMPKGVDAVWFGVLILLTIPFPYPILGIQSKTGCQAILDISAIAYLVSLAVFWARKIVVWTRSKYLDRAK